MGSCVSTLVHLRILGTVVVMKPLAGVQIRRERLMQVYWLHIVLLLLGGGATPVRCGSDTMRVQTGYRLSFETCPK